MAEQVVTNVLFKTFGQAAVKAAEENKAKPPPEDSFGDLPAGIDGGIAQLKHMGLEKVKKGDNVGKLMFRAQGVVVSPEHFPAGSHNRVKGLNTTIMKVCAKTDEASVREFIASIQDEVKKAWPKDEGEIDPDMLLVDEAGTLEKTMALLVARKPHFKFRTWKGADRKVVKRADGFILIEVDEDGKEGRQVLPVKGAFKTEFDLKKAAPWAARGKGTIKSRVTNTWQGWIEHENSEPVGGDVQDATGDGQVQEELQEGQATEVPEADAGDADADGALAELAAIAGDASKDKKERKAAEDRLREIAHEAGIEDGQFDGANTYEDVVEMIAQAKAGGEGPAESQEEATEPEPEPEPLAPAVGLCCRWTRLDAKGNPMKDKAGKAVKPLEVEVLTCFPKNSTATLKDLVTGKPILGADKKPLKVGWDSLSPSL